MQCGFLDKVILSFIVEFKKSLILNAIFRGLFANDNLKRINQFVITDMHPKQNARKSVKKRERGYEKSF